MIEGNGIAKTILKDIVGEMAKRKGKKMLMIIGKGREEVPEVDRDIEAQARIPGEIAKHPGDQVANHKPS